MINKTVYKNAKISEKEKNKRCAYINIFKRIVDMIMIVFVGSKTLLRLLLTRISWPQDSYSKKAPPFLAFVTFLANFYPLWTNRGLNINIQSTQCHEAYYFKRTLKEDFLFFHKIFFQLSIQEILPCFGYLICSPNQARQNYGRGFLKKCFEFF